MNNKKYNNIQDVYDYLDANQALKNCVNELEELRKEKQEILALIKTGNPPENIIDRMNENSLGFKKLLKKSEMLKSLIKNSSEEQEK